MRRTTSLLKWGLFILLASTALATMPGMSGATGLVYLNEVAVQGAERIELYNPSGVSIDVSGWTISGSNGSFTVPGGTVVPPAGYKEISFPGDIMGDLGGETSIADLTNTDQDIVKYGQAGGAPLAPPGGSISLCRAPDGSAAPPFFNDPGYSDAGNWTLDLTATFDAPNDAPAPSLGTTIRLNEVKPLPPGGNTYEYFNPFPLAANINIAGWWLTDGISVVFLNGVVPGGGVLAQNLPTQIEITLVAYLFDADGVRVDQIGLLGAPIHEETCFARCPDGAGPADGFDFSTSGGGDTLLPLPCTLGELNTTNPQCSGTAVGSTRWGAIRFLFR